MSTIDIPGYKIVKTLGVGGQATVYLAIQKGFDREVALKVMSPALAADPTFGERFIREAKIVAKLNHKSIVTVYDVGESGNFYYLAMEYLPGGDLKSRIADGMKARESLSIISTLASSLHFAHEKGYIHRDVKSENILFNGDNEPLLTDFGIAKASNSSTQMTQTGKLIGTPEYMSPEQCRGKTVDGRSDLYSLGIILYEMLTKGVPYTGEDSVAVCIKHVTKPLPQLPVRLKHFQWLLDLLLAKDPAQRFQTGEELAKSINEFKRSGKQSDSEKVVAKPGKKQPKTTKPKRATVATDEELDAFDDLHTERRTFTQEESKSKVPAFVSLILVVLAGAGGYLTQDKWFPQAKEFVENLSGEPQNNKQVVSETKPSQQEQLSNKSTLNQTKEKETTRAVESPDIDALLQEADALVQFQPQKLEDIKNALKLVATVNTLEKDNKNAQLIYQNIINISLAEAATLADEQKFEEANQWVQLVEVEEPGHALLDATKQKVVNLQSQFDEKQTEIEAEKEQLAQVLENANKALSENRLSSPPNDNAIALFNQVLAIEPDNHEAKLGLEKVADAYENLIEKAINENSFARARSMLTRFNSISKNEPLKNGLRQKITQSENSFKAAQKERKRLAAIEEQKRLMEQARMERLSDPLIQMQLDSGLDAAQSLEQQMILVEPEVNNALFKYRSVLEIDDRNVAAQEGIKRIETLIIEKLTREISIANKLEAQVWLNKLRIYDSNHSQLSGFEKSVNEIVESVPVASEPDEANEELKQDPMSALVTENSSDLQTAGESIADAKEQIKQTADEIKDKDKEKQQQEVADKNNTDKSSEEEEKTEDPENPPL